LPRPRQALLEPRKSPVQARSTASVSAILEATIQVLLDVGKERLTTTRVAYRAGVSVGTLYQYFPNKSALLQAVLRNHLESVAYALEEVSREERGRPLAQMVTRLVNTFLDAKMKNLKTSTALYSLSSDVDGWRIANEIGIRVNRSIAILLTTASEPLNKEPQVVASMIQGAMAGVSRRLLESVSPEKEYQSVREELVLMMRAYLDVRSSKSSD
jgi:AcrR family transcriptional regulator